MKILSLKNLKIIKKIKNRKNTETKTEQQFGKPFRTTSTGCRTTSMT